MRDEAERSHLKGDRPMNEQLRMAQHVGRWPSGAKLTAVKGPGTPIVASDPSADRSARDATAKAARDADSTLTRDDYFDDPTGKVCPMFAHVRVAFPRNVLGAK